TRPFRQDLVDFEEKPFEKTAQEAFEGPWASTLAIQLERFVYTAQQALCCYLDLFYPTASPRVAGTIFECLIACALNRVSGMPIGSGTVRAPALDAVVNVDLGIMQGADFLLLVATKTSTRERLSQPFVQKYLVERVVKSPPKTILIVIS